MPYADLTSAAILADFSERAIAIVYNGTATSGIVRGMDIERERSASEATMADQATLILLKTAVSEPGYGDTAVIAGKTWRVMRKLKGGGAHTSKVLIERNRGRVG